MPVHINEMIIRAHINEPQQPVGTGQAAAEPLNKDEIIKECAEVVLEILQHQRER